jgi:nitric oxide reductase NorD protein
VGNAVALVRRATANLADAMQARRTRAGARSRVVRLDDVRRRLELLVTAMYDRPIPITTAEPARRAASSWRQIFTPRHLRRPPVLPATDGERIQLPREIESTDADAALAEYRLMAIEQAERIARRTAALVATDASPVERDLYLLREGAVIDASIARTAPGLRGALMSARERALVARPALASLTPAERAVEELLRQSLAANLTRESERAVAGPPDESLVWARHQLREIAETGGKYRGIAPVAAWGTIQASAQGEQRLKPADELATFRGSRFGVGQHGHGTGSGGSQSTEGGLDEGTSQFRRDGEAVLHDDGPRRVASASAGAAASGEADDGADDPAAERTEPESVQPETAARNRTRASSRPPTSRSSSRVPAPKPAGLGIEYPEWDWETGDYRPLGAVVRSHEPDLSDDRWGNSVLARHGALVRRLREQFERLRARRTRLNQQRDGDELDLTACVRAWVDQRTGHAVDDRLYIAVRPARRGLAIALLIDVSGSTDEWIDARRRVIDVEKVALLLASEALDALGDLYAVLTFSGKGRANVRMRTVKGFDETNGPLVRRRIAALEPEGYTRAGAAIRHAAALLEQQPAAHRLLLIISDGKPNDVDGYEGLSGVEDTRQAIREARRQGVYPFCLTIDRQGQEYLGRIFGEAGHTILRNPQQLPTALVKVVKHLLAS